MEKIEIRNEGINIKANIIPFVNNELILRIYKERREEGHGCSDRTISDHLKFSVNSEKFLKYGY